VLESDPSLLRNKLNDIKKYLPKANGLPEELSAVYEKLSKKADEHA
jgi:hypothetical protein